MANRLSDRPKSGIRIQPRYIILFFILTFFVLGGVYLSQQTQLKTIAEEKVELQSELDDYNVEEERLERMLEYMQTTDYLIQYAREKLGYVFSDDWKFYDEDTETQNVTTAQDAGDIPIGEITPNPTPTPTPTPTPEPTPTPDTGDVPIVTFAP
jgi:cell division protein FtsB